MRITSALLFTAAAFGLAMPAPALAGDVERQFDDFFRQQEKFAARDKKTREEGYVLNKIYDNKGKRTGQLSLGGGPEPAPVYHGATTYNFTGRDFNEPQTGGIINLRIGF